MFELALPLRVLNFDRGSCFPQSTPWRTPLGLRRENSVTPLARPGPLGEEPPHPGP